MTTSRDDEHRELAATFAEKWGVDPATILWEGALHFKQIAAFPTEFIWQYKEFDLDNKGRKVRDGAGGIRYKKRKRPIPEEWIEEYEAAVKDLYT